MRDGVLLGFEVGTGDYVHIPVRHLAVTGQTQEAGKTTTLEALITRSGLRAVTFITKRGESAFTREARIRPYFREQTDWQFVASLLEASRGEKLKFERAWIIRASKGARTLADVHANVKAALETAKGMSADVYLCLDAYLDQVVPQLASVKWATGLELVPGVNAVDMSGLSVEMQHLVIRSTLLWVLEKEQGTVVVVPEAWKFIPQGRGTPVKLAAEAYIRQGAALHNYLWLDSQDLGGVEKTILRSVPVWLLGVQRESNEIKRTLDSIHAKKPKPAEVAQLRLGEFYACWGAHAVKTYVQPAWMGEEDARGHARGTFRVVEGVGRVDPRMFVDLEPEEEPGMCAQHQKLERELSVLKKETDGLRENLRDARLEEQTWREAFELEKTLAEAAIRVREAFALLMPAVAGDYLPVNEDAIVQRVLARIPTNGHGINVTAPEALRLQVQKDVAERIVGDARALPPAAKRILKVLIALDKRVSQSQASERAGVSTGGSMIEAFKALNSYGLIDVHRKAGTRDAVRSRIVAELSDLGAKDDVVEQVYQSVLYEVATEA